MSRSERLDTASLVGIVAILLVLLGCHLQATAAQATAPVSVAPATASAVEPCSDCDPNEGETIDSTELAEIAAADAAALPPCATDEATGPACYWDAQLQGNGLGQSFTWTGTELIYHERQS
jgi:hypothetical protein